MADFTYTFIPNPTSSPLIFLIVIPIFLVFIIVALKHRKPQQARQVSVKEKIAVGIIFGIKSAGVIIGGIFAQESTTTHTPAAIEIGNSFVEINSSQTGQINVTS